MRSKFKQKDEEGGGEMSEAWLEQAVVSEEHVLTYFVVSWLQIYQRPYTHSAIIRIALSQR